MSFVNSYGNTHILVGVDYVSKWVEVVGLLNYEARSVIAFLKKNIFTRFRTPQAIILMRGLIFSTRLLILYLPNMMLITM